MTDQERQKADELIGRLEVAVGEIFPRDSANARLINAALARLYKGLLIAQTQPHPTSR